MNDEAWLWRTLVIVVASGAAVGLVVRTVLAWITCRHAARRRPELVCAPGLSVFKPLCGLDPGLEDNLRALLRQDYPGMRDGGVQVIFGVTSPTDPALVVARRLASSFPTADIAIVVGDPDAAKNPKVANLIGMAPHARHGLWLVSDSNVRVAPGYLRDMVATLQLHDVGLVANLVVAGDGRGLGSVFEQLQLCGIIAAGVAAGDLIGHPCVIGKSMLLRRDDLAALGGLRAFGDVLGEDYVMGQAFARAGLGVEVSSHVVHAEGGAWSLRRFGARHLRWCQMRRWIAPTAYVFEPLLMPSAWALALLVLALAPAAWAGQAAVSPTGLGALAVLGLAIACAIEGVQARALHHARPSWRRLLATPLKDLAMLGLWLAAWVVRGVQWRGHAFRIGPGSQLVDVNATEALEPFLAPSPGEAVP